MSVPPELMSLIQGGAGTGGGPKAGASPQPMPGAGPAGAPMSTPQPNDGERQNAMISVSMAMDMLEQALPAFGSESEEGRALVGVLSKMGNIFGTARTKSQDLIPAELMQLLNTLPQAGGMSPEAKAMGQQPAIPMPGGMPGAMPR